MSSDPHVRRAEASELIDLRWDVLREGRPRDTAWMPGDDDADTRHWALVEGERIVGCVTVMAQPWPDDPTHGPPWRLRGMAVARDRQRLGLGSVLLRGCQADVAAPLWCDARMHAIPFYASHGWVVRTEVFEVPNVGPHRRMTWTPA